MFISFFRKSLLLFGALCLLAGAPLWAQNPASGKPSPSRPASTAPRQSAAPASNPYGADPYGNNSKEEPKSASVLATDEKIVLQLEELVKAVKELREQNQAQTAVNLLQVQQNRLTALETQLTAGRAVVASIKDKQLNNIRRNDNIRNEMIGRGVLDQSEAERLVRADIEAERVRLVGELSEAEQQLTVLQAEYDQTRLEVEQIKQQVMRFINTQPADQQPNN